MINSCEKSKISEIVNRQPSSQKIKWKHEMMDCGSSCPRCFDAFGLPCVFLTDLRNTDDYLRSFPGRLNIKSILPFQEMTRAMKLLMCLCPCSFSLFIGRTRQQLRMSRSIEGNLLKDFFLSLICYWAVLVQMHVEITGIH